MVMAMVMADGYGGRSQARSQKKGGPTQRISPPNAGDALLAVEHLELVLRALVEVDQPERIALEQRFDDRLLLLAAIVGINVVALVLRLNGKLAA